MQSVGDPERSSGWVRTVRSIGAYPTHAPEMLETYCTRGGHRGLGRGIPRRTPGERRRLTKSAPVSMFETRPVTVHDESQRARCVENKQGPGVGVCVGGAKFTNRPSAHGVAIHVVLFSMTVSSGRGGPVHFACRIPICAFVLFLFGHQKYQNDTSVFMDYCTYQLYVRVPVYEVNLDISYLQ